MPDNARRTGPALEAHFQFLLWLIPTVEKFPRSQKFLLGDRIQTTAAQGAISDAHCAIRSRGRSRNPSRAATRPQRSRPAARFRRNALRLLRPACLRSRIAAAPFDCVRLRDARAAPRHRAAVPQRYLPVTKTAAIAASIERSPRRINLLFMLLFKPILDHRA
jgi:hypothetical protein